MVDIYGTLGPKCSAKEILVSMFDAGMTGVRLNLSHITLHHAAQQIETLQAAARECGKTAQLLIDMQGPELRIGALEKPIALKDGETAVLGKKGIPVPELVLPVLVPGQKVLLDDGKILLTVLSADKAEVEARVLRGGMLSSRKSIALPGAEMHTPTMTETDRENISIAGQYGVTAVMQPFVRDRGDLGNAMPLWELPRVQKNISVKCRCAQKKFMVVTQMLASMEHNAVPTRAEVSDIFNAVCDGAASVMVTGETAVGEHPVEAIRYLANTVREAQAYLEGR